jgi:glutathione S-transferase
MLRLYFAPQTRAVRVLWLLEELGLAYELERVEFHTPAKAFFSQATPTGKLPTLVDGDVVMCESGAIVEYLLERYGAGRLAPAPGTQQRASFLQWLHFAESTAFPPLGNLVWLTRYLESGARHEDLVEYTRRRAATTLDFVERALAGRTYLVGDEFSAADVMMGFTLLAARSLGVLDERQPALADYLARLLARPALQKAIRTA